MKLRSHRRSIQLAFVVLFIVAFSIAFLGIVPTPHVSIDWSQQNFASSTYRTSPGSELVLVYIGAAGCGASNSEELFRAVRGVRETLRGRAERAPWSFSSIGVAVDASAERGLDHLDKFGQFDEVNAGRGWLNTGGLQYIWEEIPGEAATPQLLIIHREVSADDGGWSVRNRRVLSRHVGANKIIEWYDREAPLGSVPSSTASTTKG